MPAVKGLVSAAVVLFAFTLLTGCARYEYAITQPPDLNRHIGTKSDQVVELDPLLYRLRTADNRLVVRIYNQGDDPVELLGEQSFVVDPQGQSRPLRGQTIAPHAFVKMIFPPMRPRVYDSGPRFGVGLGVGISSRRHFRGGPHYHGHFADPQPRYLYVYDDDQQYWHWNGAGGEMRLTLVYRRADQQFQHAFGFKRIKK